MGPKAGPRSRVKRESSDSETEKDKIKKVSSDSENEKDKGDKLHKTTDTNGAVTKKIKIGPRSQVGPKIDKTDSEGEDIKSDVHAKVKDEKPALDIKDDVKDEKTNSKQSEESTEERTKNPKDEKYDSKSDRSKHESKHKDKKHKSKHKNKDKDRDRSKDEKRKDKSKNSESEPKSEKSSSKIESSSKKDSNPDDSTDDEEMNRQLSQLAQKSFKSSSDRRSGKLSPSSKRTSVDTDDFLATSSDEEDSKEKKKKSIGFKDLIKKVSPPKPVSDTKRKLAALSDDCDDDAPSAQPKPKKKKKVEHSGDDAVSPKDKYKNRAHELTHSGAVNEHGVEDGPECYKCGVVCKNQGLLKNHVLSHFYTEFYKR